MSIRTLKDVTKIGDFDVVTMDKLRDIHHEKFNESGAMDYKWFEKDVRPHNFIYIRHDVNSLSFTLQNGPVKENGVNGCQVETIIEAARMILDGLNKEFPCDENIYAITHLEGAIRWLDLRTRNRITRGVEGTASA